ITKARLKFERDRISLWFSVSYVFTFFTYLVTLAFVWIPLIFSYDTWNLEIKKSVAWLLPIIAIIASWLQCLHILRKSPCGPYIMMMARIFKSFFNLTIIWITTLICFAFSFQLVMRDSGTHPWDDPIIANHSSIGMSMFQSFTKISAMMIGEVEANDILERRAWVANLLLIMFEIITVILLMNLMISLAVGDVSELRASAEEKLLRVKTNYCIEALHLSEKLDCCPGTALYKKRVNNIMVISKNDDTEFSTYLPLKDRAKFPVRSREEEKVHDVTLNAKGIRFFSSLISNNFDRQSILSVNNAILRIVEANGSGVGAVEDDGFKSELTNLKDNESFVVKYKRWLIGLRWKAFLNIA
uniref:Ion transport domain-containing protein n=1 Tax=Panagrolaimus sp. PS1159 TaxID=55785 RepID=A0AC35FAQ1_9BILA